MHLLSLLSLLAGLAPLAAAKGHHPLFCCEQGDEGRPFGCKFMWREWEFGGKNPACVLTAVSGAFAKFPNLCSFFRRS